MVSRPEDTIWLKVQQYSEHYIEISNTYYLLESICDLYVMQMNSELPFEKFYG